MSNNRISYDESEALEEFVLSRLVPLIPKLSRIISVDGLDGVGKSTLARCLNEKGTLPIIALDDFLNKNQGYFFSALNVEGISRAIDAALNNHRALVVEGCLVDAALERTGRKADFKIYVERASRMLSNPDVETVDEFDLLYSDKSAEDLISGRGSSARTLR